MARRTLNISLSPELEDFVATRVASGRYLTASEVVRDGLRLLEERERLREETLARVRQKVEDGFASLDRGEGVDGETVLAELERRLKSD
ncbi:MAG: type II toxin-antitoxin system ParD family antitoxin [bacterium]